MKERNPSSTGGEGYRMTKDGTRVDSNNQVVLFASEHFAQVDSGSGPSETEKVRMERGDLDHERPSKQKRIERAIEIAKRASDDLFQTWEWLANGMDPADEGAVYEGWLERDFKEVHDMALQMVLEELKERREKMPDDVEVEEWKRHFM